MTSKLDDILNDVAIDCTESTLPQRLQITHGAKQQIKTLMLALYRAAEESKFDTRGEFFQKVADL